MKGGKREVRKAKCRIRMFVPSKAELVRWLEEGPPNGRLLPNPGRSGVLSFSP